MESKPPPCTQSSTQPTFKQTLDMFADHSPATRAQFATIAAVNEANQTTTDVLSPNHQTLVDKFQFIDKLTKHQDHVSVKLKQKVTEHYICSKMTTGESMKRVLHYHDHPIETKPPAAPNTASVMEKPLKKCKPIKTRTCKKRERGNIKWKLVPVQKFQSVALAKDYIRQNFPTLRVKSTNTTKQCTIYYCKKEDKCFGTCRGYLHFPIDPTTDIISVTVKVTTDPECACRAATSVSKRGLSNVTRDKVRSIIQSNPTIQPNQVRLQMIRENFNVTGSDDADRKGNDITSRQISKNQIARAVSYDKCRGRSDGSLGPVLMHVGHLVSLKEKFTFRPPLLPFSSTLPESRLPELGCEFHDSKHLKVVPTSMIVRPRQNAFLMMTVLDPHPIIGDTGITVQEKNLYKYIEKVRSSKSALEESEGNTYDLTTVITSLGFLWNACQCEQLDWRVTVSSDGTADVFSNDWTLLTMGVHSHSKKGTKQFKPFFYILAPGERQECFAIGVVSFLKYVRLLFGITNIRFAGGCVCDRSHVFVNIYKIAFPDSKLGQCYQHILRKFLPGKGNGHYSTLVSKKSFLKNVALSDVRQLYHCLSKKMFQKYAKLVKEAWMEEKENKITKTFFESYIEHPLFSTWNVNFSSVPGCTPTNNPVERNNSVNAGTKEVDGLMRPGYSMSVMLGQELPKMIALSAPDKLGVERNILLEQEQMIFHDRSLIHKELIRYFGLFDGTIDCRTIRDEINNSVVRHIVNSEEYIGLPVTIERINTYKDSLEGITEYTFKDRILYFDTVSSLCTVTGQQQRDGTWKYCGSCSDWHSRTYCVHAAVFQYAERLKSYGRTLPTNKVKRVHQLDATNSPKQMLKKRYLHVQTLLTNITCRIIALAEQKEDAVNPAARKKVASFPNLILRSNTIMQMGKPKVLEKIKIVNQSLTMAQDLSDVVAGGSSDSITKEVNMSQVLLMLQELIIMLNKL